MFCQAIVDISWRTMTMLPLDLLHCRHHRQLLQVTLKSSVQVEIFSNEGNQLKLPYSLALLLSKLIARGNTAGTVRALEQVRMQSAAKQAQAQAQRSKQERM